MSRVLNGKSGVSDSTREAVLTALDVLGYERPTQLRGQRARLIGLVLPELQNPIFPALAEVIGGALAQRGFTPVLCTRTAGGLSEADYVDMLLDQHASGVVFAGGHYAELAAPHDHYRLLHDRRASRRFWSTPPLTNWISRASPPTTPSPRARRSGTWRRSGTSASACCSARRTTCRRVASSPRSTEHAERAGLSRRAGRARAVLAGRRPSRNDPDAAAGRHRRHLRQRRARARRHPGRRAGPDCRAGRRLGRRLRRLRLAELHRSAAHHGPPAHRGDGQGRGCAAGQPDGDAGT